DVLVRPRSKPHDGVVARFDHDVAALRAVRAHRRGTVELPRPRLVERVLREERTHGTEIDDVPRPWMRHVLALELANHGAITTFADVENRMLRDVVHEPDAACTQNASVGDVNDVAAKVLDGIEALRFPIASLGPAFLKGVVLQLAFAGLIADRAIERMIDEQHLEHALPRLERFVRVNAPPLSVSHRR